MHEPIANLRDRTIFLKYSNTEWIEWEMRIPPAGTYVSVTSSPQLKWTSIRLEATSSSNLVVVEYIYETFGAAECSLSGNSPSIFYQPRRFGTE